MNTAITVVAWLRKANHPKATPRVITEATTQKSRFERDSLTLA
jgi:hypothetical protein